MDEGKDIFLDSDLMITRKAAKIRDLVLAKRKNTTAHNIEMQSDELGFEAQLGSFVVCSCSLLWLCTKRIKCLLLSEEETNRCVSAV